MKVLVACEFSGIVRDAFLARGHDAVSCDVLPTDAPGPHIRDDVRNHLDKGWDMMIAFPPCTHLAVSGARWFKYKRRLQAVAVQFARDLWHAPIEHIAMENPVSVLSTHLIPATQTIHPWQFGHEEEKTTCLWLKNLPLLQPTCVVERGENFKWKLPPSDDRWKLRSVTYTGIADAMSEQWTSKALQKALFV